jgi:hypothetical protein
VIAPAVQLVDAEWPRARFILRERAAYAPMLIALLVARKEPFVIDAQGFEVSIDLMVRGFDSERVVKAMNAHNPVVAGQVELVEGCFVFTRKVPPRNPDCSHLDFVPIMNALRRS